LNIHPVCIIYTQDEALLRRLRGFLGSMTRVQHAGRPASLLTSCRQFDPALLLVDLCAEDAQRLIAQIAREHQDSLLIALAPGGLEDVADIERLGVWSILDAETDRRGVQSTIRCATDHLTLLEENRVLRAEPAPNRSAPAAGHGREESGALPSSLYHFSRAFQHFDKVETMLETLSEGIANWAKVARVGVFASVHPGEPYRLYAGLKCLEGTDQLEFTEEDALLCWMRVNPHLIARSTLHHIGDSAQAALLKQILDTLGAEAVIPLHGAGRITGWVFFGRRVTGLPFEESALEELVVLAEHMSIILENALLYEEVGVQKSLSDTLLHSIPAGIMAVDERMTVRSFNDEAARILHRDAGELLGGPVSRLGSQLADLFIRCLRGETLERQEWTDPATKRNLLLQTRRLHDAGKGLGAVLIIQDVTEERKLREKQDRIERAAFWTELAAAISHEVCNPLVAISTFAQLLPERYDDADFRENFSALARNEIERLNKLLDQINAFANPPRLDFQPVQVRDVLDKSIEVARTRVAFNGTTVKVEAMPDLPAIRGDRTSLVDCFAHLITNSVEASAGISGPRIEVAARMAQGPGNKDGVVISVTDNGRGIPLEISEKIFSPFCSMKARGIGLGLPIVKRTVTDHNGKVTIETSDKGTTVAVELPVGAAEKTEEVEA